MNIIGNKIKEVRRKKDMTQEKMAELLGVSYQTVSKWETGVNLPDLTLIVPLSRLLGISTDELLGVTTGDARRAEFDAAYENYWYKDHSKMMEIATEAVAEFPGDMKYLSWLANMEFLLAIPMESDEDYKSTLEKSVAHFKTVIENTNDPDLKNNSIPVLCMALKHLGRIDEAKSYAEIVPEEAHHTRDEVLTYCLYNGTELVETKKRILYKSVQKVLFALHDIYDHPAPDDCVTAALDASDAVIKAFITDENYIEFGSDLGQISIKRAEFAIAKKLYGDAVEYLKEAKKYAEETDTLFNSGAYYYTCPLFDGHKYECNVEKEAILGNLEFWKYSVSKPVFDPIRDREDFKELL